MKVLNLAYLQISFSEFLWDNIYLIGGLVIGLVAAILLRKNLNIKP